MKLFRRVSTSISFSTRLKLIAISLIVAVAVPISMTPKVSADCQSIDECQAQIEALQKDIDAANAIAKEYAAQADTYANAVAILNNQAAAIQAQIDISQAKYDKLEVQIADTEKKIIDNKDALGQTIASMYVDDSITPLEMLASSQSISDFLDKQEYRSSVRDQLVSTISTIKDLKAQLVKQKAEVVQVLGDQKNSKDALAVKQKAQQDLLNQTQGQEAAYQQIAANTKSRQAELNQILQSIIAAAYSNAGAKLIRSGAAPGYPWDASTCPMQGWMSTGGVNGNGEDGYGYGCRQCVSYVAWRVARETGGYYPVNWGNASNFPSSAESVGYSWDSTPSAGSIGVMHAYVTGYDANGNPYQYDVGHVVWVDSVNDDGTVTVEQYNYNYMYPDDNYWGMYSMMNLDASAFWAYIHIK